MSRKSTITSYLKAVNNQWKASEEEIKKIYATDGYTPEFKEEKAEEVIIKLNNLLDQVKEKTLQIVDEKLESMFKPTANTFNAGYQARLTNVLSIVSLSGSDMDLRDLKAMIEPFNEDYTALQGIRKAIENVGIDKREDYPTVLSSLATGTLEDRKETHRKLVKFKDSFSEFRINKSVGQLEWIKDMELLGYDPFFETLDDDLNYSMELDPSAYKKVEPVDPEIEIK